MNKRRFSLTFGFVAQVAVLLALPCQTLPKDNKFTHAFQVYSHTAMLLGIVVIYC